MRRDPSTTIYSNHGALDWGNRSSADDILNDIRRVAAEMVPLPEPSREAIQQAAGLGFFAIGVPCCAGADGLRIRVVALEPVTPLDLGVARMKLARWYPREAEVIELAAAGCWR